MKKIALAVAMSVAATSAFAGNVDPVVAPVVEVVEQTSSSSSSGALLPILALLIIGAAVAASD